MKKGAMELNERGLQAIKRTVGFFIFKNPAILEYYSREDLEQDVVTRFMSNGFFKKYNPEITSFEYYVSRATKNRLIDLSRTRKYAVSLDVPAYEGGAPRVEGVQGMLSDPYAYVVLREMVDSVPDTRISRNYTLTWKGLFGYVIQGYTAKELHKILGLSSGRISQLISELLGMLRSEYSVI